MSSLPLSVGVSGLHCVLLPLQRSTDFHDDFHSVGDTSESSQPLQIKKNRPTIDRQTRSLDSKARAARLSRRARFVTRPWWA